MTIRRFRCLLKGLCCRLSPISLLPHEEIILLEEARSIGVQATIRPSYIVYDRASGSFIALSYVLELNNGACPFLNGTKCMVHRVYKPLVCRAFPYIPREVKYFYSSEAKMIFARATYGLSRKCPVIRRDLEMLGGGGLGSIARLKEYMPDEVYAAIEMEYKRSVMLSLLSKLWQRGVVDLEMIGTKHSVSDVVNLYDLLRRYYPDLPYTLDIHKVIRLIKRM